MTELVSVTRTVVDTEAGLRRYLEVKHSTGRLLTPIDQIKALPTARDPEKLWLRVTVLEPAPKPSLRYRMMRFDRRHPIAAPVLKALLFGVGVLVALIGFGVALFQIFVHTVSPATMRGLGGVLLLLGLLVALATLGTKSGSGRHSSHDGKGWHYTDCK